MKKAKKRPIWCISDTHTTFVSRGDQLCESSDAPILQGFVQGLEGAPVDLRNSALGQPELLRDRQHCELVRPVVEFQNQALPLGKLRAGQLAQDFGRLRALRDC